MEIKRDKYLNDLVTRMGNGLIKIVTGIRRCGKTYLVFDLFERHLRDSGVDPSRIVALALDDEQSKRYRDPDELYRYVLGHIGDSSEMHYVLLDEVQYAMRREELRSPDGPPALYGVLNGLLHKDNVDVYVTGSNSKLLTTDVMTEFRGRGDEVRMHPLSFSEFMQGFDGDRYEGWAEYVMFGGLPLTLTMQTPEQKSRYLTNLFGEVYLADVVARNHLTKTQELDDLVNILASSIGSLTNPSRIEATFRSILHSKLDADTIGRYIGCLEEAFLVSEAQRFNVKGRRYIGTPKKYYFEDMGLRNARLSFRQIEEPHIMENVIFNELVARGFSVDVGVVDRRLKVGGKDERRRYEVDFVANLGYERFYIQSALHLDSPEKIAQEKRSLLGIDDNFKKVVIVKDVVRPYMDDDGIMTMSLFDFLLDPMSLEW
jgi:predicted AAA+ superfamily ATPase